MAFTTGLISTADLGTWNYYIFTDSNAISQALDGLASWFSGSSGMLQNAALLGSLILLTIFLYGAAVHKPTIGVGNFGFWLFFLIMLGTTGTARVTNMYTGTVSVRANVPAVVLVPASVFSVGAYRVFLTLEQAFQPATGSYMSVKEDGFLSPLDLLLSLRSPRMLTIHPWMTDSLNQVMQDCTVAPAGTAAPTIELSQSKDILLWLKTNGSNVGLTSVYKKDDYAKRETTIMGCGLAWTWLQTEYQAMATGASPLFARVLNEETKSKKKSTPWTAADLNLAYAMFTTTATGVNQTATEFTMNALVAANVKFNLDCMGQVSSVTTQEICSVSSAAIADGRERSKTEGAMAGSSFLKTMFTSIGFLQALFFMLFPVIALYGLIVVQNTAKIVGGYIFFGIWCQSWLLVIVPIQSYIQFSVIEEMSRIAGGSGGLTLGNASALYDMLSTKIGLAGDLMASSQMLSLALLSGSIYAVSGMAQKWAGAQHNDVSMVQNKAAAPAALTNVTPMTQQQVVNGSRGIYSEIQSSTGSGSLTMGDSVGTSNSLTSSTAVTRASQQSSIKSLVSNISASTGLGFSESDTAAIEEKIGAHLAATGKLDTGFVSALAKKFGVGKGGASGGEGGASSGEGGAASGAASGGGGGGGGTGANITGNLSKSKGTTESFAASGKASKQNDKNLTQSQSAIDSIIRGNVEGFNRSSSQLSGSNMTVSQNLSQYGRSLMELGDKELAYMHASVQEQIASKRHTDEDRILSDKQARDVMRGYGLSGDRGALVTDIMKMSIQSEMMANINPVSSMADLEAKNKVEGKNDRSKVLSILDGDGSAAFKSGNAILNGVYKEHLAKLQNIQSMDTLKNAHPEAFDQLATTQTQYAIGIGFTGLMGIGLSLLSFPKQIVEGLSKAASNKAPSTNPAGPSSNPNTTP